MVRFTSARIDENGNAHGGKAGDQNGREVMSQNWYLRDWYVLRCKDPEKAAIIAQTALDIAANKLVGYDQNQRNDLYNALKSFGFDLDALMKAVEVDCSSMVRFCLAVAKIFTENFTTPTEVSHIMATGEFDLLTSSKFCRQSAYLRKGDVLVTRKKGHTGIITSDGPKAYEGSSDGSLGHRLLEKGDYGPDVAELQSGLTSLKDAKFDPMGVDKDFGPNTLKAVKAFQRAQKIEVDGIVGPITVAHLKAAMGVGK